MTDEEVQIIYDYLHENYEYKNGELYIKPSSILKVKKNKLGSLWHSRKTGCAQIRATIYIKQKNYSLPLTHLIFIYHFKLKPKFIVHLDSNPMNCRIENLISEEKRKLCNLRKNMIKKPNGFSTRKLPSGTQYVVRFERNRKQINIGPYKNKDMALKSYEYAQKLALVHDFTDEEIKTKTREKYPPEYCNKQGYRGVISYGKKFAAKITINKQKIKIGVYKTPLEAHQAYLKAKEERASIRKVQESPAEGKIPKQKIQEAVHSLSEAKTAGEKIIDKFCVAINNLRDK